MERYLRLKKTYMLLLTEGKGLSDWKIPVWQLFEYFLKIFFEIFFEIMELFLRPFVKVYVRTK